MVFRKGFFELKVKKLTFYNIFLELQPISCQNYSIFYKLFMMFPTLIDINFYSHYHKTLYTVEDYGSSVFLQSPAQPFRQGGGLSGIPAPYRSHALANTASVPHFRPPLLQHSDRTCGPWI